MSLLGNIGFKQKTKVGSSPPFDQGSAKSGVYVNTGDGSIRLGSDPFGPNPQPFLETVILDTNLFNFNIRDFQSGIQSVQIVPIIGLAKFGQLDIADIIFNGDGSVIITSKPGGGIPARQVFFSDPSTERVLVGDFLLQDASPVFLNCNSAVGEGQIHADAFDVSNFGLTAAYSVNGNIGVSGTFTTVDLKTVTVEGGIITSIV
jgi:hypothetical protein